MQFFRKLSTLLIAVILIQIITPMISNQSAIIYGAQSGPVVQTQSPAHNSNNAAIRPTLEVWFDEAITISDPNKAIRIRREDTNVDVLLYSVSNWNVSVSGTKLTVTLNQDLELNTNYIAIIENDAVKNVSNNMPLTSDYTWKFKTLAAIDNTPPTITGVSYETCMIDPNTGNHTASCTATTTNFHINPTNVAIKLNFSEPVFLGTGAIQLSSTDGSDNRLISMLSSEITGASSQTITVRPSTPLLAGKEYRLTVVGGNSSTANFKDAANNTLATNFSTTFTTLAADPIQLSSYLPNITTDVPLNPNQTLTVTLNFNQSVLAVANKHIKIYSVSDNTQVGSGIAVRNVTTASQTFTYTTPVLNPNTEYYIVIDTGSFISSTGTDSYRGITNTTAWKFKTKALVDTQAPQLAAVSPVHTATNVPTNEKIVLTFNEPVYANTGNILIKSYSTNIIYRSINVTSARLSGAGSNVITIDPHRAISGEAAKTFTANTKYYVEIPNNAFKDASNNMFAGISHKDGYTFTVGETTASKPLLQGLYPINGNETVAAGTPTFSMTFDKPIQLNTGSSSVAKIIPKQPTSTVVAIDLDARIRSGNNKIVDFVPRTALVANTEYYINVPNDLIQDASGSYYDGILNTYQWTFKTLGGDKTPPKILRAESFGNKIRIVYDELLDEWSVPQIANYYVTVNGVPKSISSLVVEKNAVVFTMYEQIASNQSVLVSYTKSVISPVKDISGNIADNFSNQAAPYGQITSVPIVIASSYSGRTITLEFNEPLQKINALAYLQFAVSVNNASNAVTSIQQNGSKVTLGVTTSIPNNRSVVVSYNKGSYPLQGFANDVAPFTLTVGQGAVQNPATPAVSSITASNDTISIVYNQPVWIAPQTNQYTVTVNGLARAITNATLDNQTVRLTLSSAIQAGQTVTVSYSALPNVLVSGTTSNQFAQSFTNMTATVGDVAAGKVTLQSVIAKGNTITLSFNKALDQSYLPSTAQLYLLIDGNSWSIRSMKIEDTKLIITLPSAIRVGAEGTLSYYTTTDTLRATDGERVGMLSNVKITNQTTVIDILSDDYVSISNGVLLKESTATKSNTTSPSGRSVTQYAIDNAKITTVVDAFSDANIKDAIIRFEVPTSQQAAVVLFPMAAIQNADRKGNFTFSVKYGDTYFEVPVKSIDVSKAVNLNSGSAFSNQLVLKIETGSTNKTAALESAIRSNSAALAGGPYVFEAEINGPTGSSSIPLKGNLIRKVVLPVPLAKERAGAVFYDEVAGTISGVPTTFATAGSSTEVTFMRPGSSAYAIITSNKSYNDIANHWASSTILNLSRKFIIEGHSATAFNPQRNITRGEFATYLVKGLGLSADKEAAKQFKDVNSASMLGGYIGAAAKAGIVSGVSANEFKPNANITRQDMAIMMMRVVAYTKMDVSLTTTPNSYLAAYTDGNKVSSYARTQVAQAIQIGVITGFTPTTISPLSNATRAEGVTMIERVLRKANYIQ